jgi:RNase P/RNase MRP subunit POP5
MTRKELYEICKKHAKDYVETKVEIPSEEARKNWSRADYLAFRTTASRAASEVEIELKSIVSQVSDEVYGELIISIGGEKA